VLEGKKREGIEVGFFGVNDLVSASTEPLI
jgi:hypothetical protein